MQSVLRTETVLKPLRFMLVLLFLYVTTGCAPNQAMLNQRGIYMEKGLGGTVLKITSEHLANLKKASGSWDPKTKAFTFDLEGLEVDQRVVEATKADAQIIFQSLVPMYSRYMEMQETLNRQTMGAISDMVGNLAPMVGILAARPRAAPNASGGCTLSLPQSADEINNSIVSFLNMYNSLRTATTQPSIR